MIEDERVTTRWRGLKMQGGLTSPMALRRQRREEVERQQLELGAMKEMYPCMTTATALSP